MLKDESVALIKTREITPVIDLVRDQLPMKEMKRIEMIVTSKDFRIEDEEGEAQVVGYMRDTSTWTKKVEEAWKPIKGLFFSVHKASCDSEKETAPEIEKIRRSCDTALKDWIKRKEAAARKRQAELERTTEFLRTQTLKQAQILALDGKIDESERMMQDAVELRAPVIMTAETKFEGVSTKPKWVPTVTDRMALIKAIADGRVPLMHTVEVRGKEEERPLILFDEVVLRYYAGKLGKQLDWPGVEVESDMSFAAKAR